MNKRRRKKLGLLLLGAGPRLGSAALVAAALWAGFYWATYSSGSL
ncbi:MAG: hypothetical protein OXN84_16440 [Albidovulum sp.]|nr:hypothetical protein [Albidovulum sp.]MDE0532710.1 hypothetical protein [Albidovulum sp.]